MRFAGFLLCCAATLALFPAQGHAGFEFVSKGTGVSESSTSPQAEPIYTPEGPMPILPAPDVQAEVLPDSTSFGSAPGGQPVYIRRQKEASAFSGSVYPASDYPPSTSQNAAALDSQGRLVIDLFPLDEQKGAGAKGRGGVALEQAMMEQGGYLRPVTTPGQNGRSAMIGSERLLKLGNASSRNAARDFMQPDLTPMPERLAARQASPVASPAQEQVYPREPEAPVQTPVIDAAPTFTEALGFGRDLPLALALSQVVPPQYSYSFTEGVDMGTSVTWEGGKPWNEVLKDMLAPSGLMAVIEGKTVTIRPARA